jgi:hypothetical protein
MEMIISIYYSDLADGQVFFNCGLFLKKFVRMQRPGVYISVNFGYI